MCSRHSGTTVGVSTFELNFQTDIPFIGTKIIRTEWYKITKSTIEIFDRKLISFIFRTFLIVANFNLERDIINCCFKFLYDILINGCDLI